MFSKGKFAVSGIVMAESLKYLTAITSGFTT